MQPKNGERNIDLKQKEYDKMYSKGERLGFIVDDLISVIFDDKVKDQEVKAFIDGLKDVLYETRV